MLELLAEPFYILSQNLLLLKLRLLVETAATFLRCLTMYVLIVKQTNMVKFLATSYENSYTRNRRYLPCC